MNELADKIHVGIAGWSYPDWEGYVYDRGVKDKLGFVAGYVDMIEINSTFYQPPVEKNSESWLRKTDDLPDFYFTAKLHQEITHEGVLSDDMVQAFHKGFGPLTGAGRLKHLLAQFRWDFADRPETRQHLSAIRGKFCDMPELVLELRHASWQEPHALEFLEGLGVTVANLDYPLAKNSFSLQECRIGRDGYLRLHGRNVKAWFDKKAGRDETYNYFYSSREIDGIKDRALSLVKTYRSLTIVANNHYEGKEVANALQMKASLTGKKVRVPPALQNHYAALKEIAAPEAGMLF
jgi:uncharacterized protein YecE (DUF72 family)